MRRLLSLFAIPFLIWFAMPVHAGHLFTQAAANEPINLSSGTGLEITQLTYEGGGNSGSVSIDFDQTGSGDAALEWSAGDAVKVSIDSWTQTFSYDTLTSDFTTASQSERDLSVTDPSLAAANITTGNATTTFTVIATAGQFRFEGYRIQVVDSRYNGTGADTITQDQVVSEDELGGGVFETAAESNQTSLGQHLDSLSGSATGELADVITILDAMTDESKALAMKLISPEQSQVLGQSATNNVSTGFDTVQVRLDSVRSGTTALSTASTQHHGQASGLSSGDDSVLERHAWLKAIGAKADRDSAGGFAGSDADFHGVMGGLDFTSDSQLTLGAAFAYGKTDVDMNDFRNGDGADIDTYQLTAYFSKSLDRVYFEGMLSYAYQNYETKRNTHLTGVARGDFNGDMFAARLVSGLPITVTEAVTVTPFIGAEAYHLRQRGYTESGAGALSLDVSSNDANRFRSIFGTKVGFRKELNDGSILSPTIQASWRHEFQDDGITTESSFLGGGGQFQSVGQDVDQNIYSLTGRLDWARTERMSIGIEIGAEAASNYRSYNGQLYGKWMF